MVHRIVVRGIHLVRVVAASVELPDFLVGQVLDHVLQFGTCAEKVLTHIGAVVGLVVLVVAVDGVFHTLLQQAIIILGEKGIPHTAPDDLDDVPVSAPEATFQLLNNLAVAAYRTIKALQVAVDYEDQVVELLAASQSDSA